MATVFHDRCIESLIGTRAQVLSTAIAMAFSTK
jgi:hypothetical protein